MSFRVVLLGLMLIFEAAAQAPTATLVGRVTDATGASIPEAKIRVVNADTAEHREARSDLTGNYTVPNLPPGRYDVTAEKTGFRRLEQSALELQVQQVARLNLRMEVGSVTEVVEVTATVPVLNTETGAKGEVVSNQELLEMPLNGRNAQDLALMVPQVLPSEDSNYGSGWAVNGARNDNNNFYIDGVSNYNISGGSSNATVSLEAVQEFKMLTNSFSAEYGRLAGGVMTMALRSGGNKLHGSAFEFLRNDKLDARNFFAGNKNKLRRNQFGGSLSGPVYLPRLYDGHNRTFFLFNLESVRQITGSSQLTAVPDSLQREGDFSQTKDARGNPVYLRDPFASGSCTATNRTACYPGNLLPKSRWNPVAQKLLPFYPLPNLPGQVNNFRTSANTTDPSDNLTIKIDQQASAKDTVSGRLVRQWQRTISPLMGSPFGNFGARTRNTSMLVALTWTRMITPTFVNEARAGVTRQVVYRAPLHDDRNYAADLGIAGINPPKDSLGYPSIAVTGLGNLGDSSNFPFYPTQTTYTWADTATWIKGPHMLKFGFELIRSQYFQPYTNYIRGYFTFSGSTTNVPFGDFMGGWPTTVHRIADVARNYFSTSNYGVFIQDDWKVTPRFTLNPGLRYDIPTPPVAQDGRMSSFDPSIGKVIIGNDKTVPNLNELLATAGLTGKVVLAKDLGLPESISYTPKTNIAPRLGFAWRPLNRMVLRGGGGIFYAGAAVNPLRTELGNMYPFTVQEQYSRVASDPNLVTLSRPFAPGIGKASGVTGASGIQIHAPSQYLQSWNLTVEREVARGTAIEISYAGSKGTHLGRRYNLNVPVRDEALRQPNNSFPRPWPAWSTVNYYSFGSNSDYSAGTAMLRKRFSDGLFFRVSYVYSKSIDDASQFYDAATGGYGGAQDVRNLKAERGRSDWDRGHSFTFNFTAEVPRRYGRLLRGWQLAGTGRATTGRPFTVKIGGNNLTAGEASRPDRLAKGTVSDPRPERWYDTNAFLMIRASEVRFGSSGRNILDGPGYVGFNLSLSKRFRVSEGHSLQFRAEAFNITNHANFGLPALNIDVANAGTITSAQSGRNLQAAFRYQF